jgi:CRP/FNR family cyclic AMP-dependent transcriptional regulator
MKKALYILGQLTDEDVEWLFRVSEKRTLGEGEVLIQLGKPIGALFFVLDGQFDVVGITGQLLNRLEWGDIVGEMSFVDAGLPSATVRAQVSSMVMAIDKGLLADKLKEDTAFAARFYLAVAMFLSSKMRDTIAILGHGDGTTSLEDTSDLLSDDMMDNMYLAGLRFERLTKQVVNQK